MIAWLMSLTSGSLAVSLFQPIAVGSGIVVSLLMSLVIMVCGVVAAGDVDATCDRMRDFASLSRTFLSAKCSVDKTSAVVCFGGAHAILSMILMGSTSTNSAVSSGENPCLDG